MRTRILRIIPLLLLLEEFPRTFKLRYARSPINAPAINHFLIVHKKAYRLEAVHDKKSSFDDMSPEIPVRINFNDPTGAESACKRIRRFVGKFRW